MPKLLSVEINNNHGQESSYEVMENSQSIQRGLNDSTFVNMHSPNAVPTGHSIGLGQGESRQILIRDFKSGHVYQNLSNDTSALQLISESQSMMNGENRKTSFQLNTQAAHNLTGSKSGSQLINIVIGESSSHIETKGSVIKSIDQ